MTRIPLLLALCLLLGGCASSGLSTGVQMSNDFIIPFSPDKTIFIETYNSSTAPLDNLTELLSARFSRRGFQVVGDIRQAHYYLQLDILEFGYLNETTRFPLNPHLGIGLGGGWGLGHGIGLGVGIGMSTLLGNLSDSQKARYTMAAYVRIQERTPGEQAISHESSLLSNASQSNTNFEQGYTYTRNAIMEKVISLFAGK